jgi:hypothetical protein
MADSTIPGRAETLEVLRFMGDSEPMLMLTGSDDGYGTRWTMHGQQVQPGIARYLTEAGYIADSGPTEFGARRLVLTAAGAEFLREGNLWWSELSLLQKIRIKLFG